MSIFKLLVKPCQSGKTFELLQKTASLIERNRYSIHVILVDNSLIQLEQLETRIQSVLKKPTLVINAENRLSADEIKAELKKKDIKFLLICSNITQIKKVDIILKTNRNNNFYVWIDEADKISEPENIKIIDKWPHYVAVCSVFFITASPTSLIKRYERLSIVEISEPYKKNYSKWTDHKIHILPESLDPIKFVSKSLKSSEPKPGQIWFIAPGSLLEMHWEVSEMLNKKRFYTLVINSDGEIFTSPRGEKTNLPTEGGDLAARIAKSYKDMKISDYPFAIIGYGRLGRGITIQHPNLLFTHAIYPPVASVSGASIYQLAGRCLGGWKDFPKWKPINIYCSPRFNDIACTYEGLAITMAKMSNINLKTYDEIEEKAEKKCKRRS